MAVDPSEWSETLVHLFALASRLEGEGQYNLAKLARAAAVSIYRQAAYQVPVPTEKHALALELKRAAESLTTYGVNARLISALKQGADIMESGRLPLIEAAPHPYVCRTCGQLQMQAPAEQCPTCGAWAVTFQVFLPIYWLNAFEPKEAVAALKRTPMEVARLIQDLPEAALVQPPPEGGWAIRNIISHLMDAQGVLDFRLELFVKEEHPRLVSQAVFSWATREDARPASTLEVFESYRAMRAETIRKLESLPLEDWWRTGQHEEFGTVSIRQHASYFAAHELTHLAPIGELRAAYLEGSRGQAD